MHIIRNSFGFIKRDSKGGDSLGFERSPFGVTVSKAKLLHRVQKIKPLFMQSSTLCLQILTCLWVGFGLTGCGKPLTGELAGWTGVSTESYRGTTFKPLGYKARTYPSLTDYSQTRRGHGRVFILRPKMFYGSGGVYIFSVDGKRDLVIDNGGSITWEQPQGQCSITLESQFISGSLQEIGRTTEVEVQEGHWYFLYFDLRNKDLIQWLDEDQGKKLLAESFKPVILPIKH